MKRQEHRYVTFRKIDVDGTVLQVTQALVFVHYNDVTKRWVVPVLIQEDVPCLVNVNRTPDDDLIVDVRRT